MDAKPIMKRFLLLVVMLAALSLSAGCSDYKKLQITSYDIDALDGFSFRSGQASARVKVDLGVLNPTRSSFLLKSFSARLYNQEGEYFGDIVSDGEVLVSPSSDEKVPVMLNITLANPMSLLGGIGRSDFDKMTADIDMTVKSRSFTKRIKKEGIPLEDLIEGLSQTTGKD